MKISLVIVAYKSGDVLLKCLDSINKFNDLGEELEVIVVDNSPEGERVRAKVEASTLTNVIYVEANNNGFGAGNNIGAKLAKGDVIGFINPDIIFIQPILKQVYSDFMDNNNLAMEGIKLLYEDLKPGFSFYFDYNTRWYRNWTIKLWNKMDIFDSNKMFISGANLFIRKKIFFDAGMFDEQIFMYYEEPEISRRIKKLNKNYIIDYNKKLRMIHLERKSTPASPKMIGIAWDSAIYYGKKCKLDYRRKIKFEYNYYYLKKEVYKFLNKDKYLKLLELTNYLESNYKDFLV